MKKYVLLLVTLVICLIILLFYVGKTKMNKSNVESKKDDKITLSTSTTSTTKKDIMKNISVNYHASIRINDGGYVIYFDPFKISNETHDADYVFITHSHYDHYSVNDIKKVIKDETKFVVSSDLESKIQSLGVSKDRITVAYPKDGYVLDDLKFDAIASYNIDKQYHKKSYNWVGYNLNINGTKYLVVGDSDVTDELRKVSCDVIFVPVGGTYTMTDFQAADLVNEIKPKYAYPVHYSEVGSKINAENFINKLDKDIKGVLLN